MSRYIDADKLTEAIEMTTWYHVNETTGKLIEGANGAFGQPLYKSDDIYKAIKEAPIVDVAPVKHGYWLPHFPEYDCGHTIKYTCSVCSIPAEWASQYCPHCGAKMDGEEQEND